MTASGPRQPELNGTPQPQSSQLASHAGPSSTPQPATPYSTVQPATVQEATQILGVSPFLPYTPSSRVVKHFDLMTLVHSTPSSSAEVYPQFAQHFQTLDQPSSPAEWEARRQYEAQLLGIMGAPPPTQQYDPYPSPTQPSHQPFDTSYRASAQHFMPYVHIPPRYQYQQHQQSHTHQVHHTQSYPTSPLTPSTSVSAHSISPNKSDVGPAAYFEKFLADTTATLAERKRAQKAPALAQQRVEMDKPDASMLAMDSSPTKKRKSEQDAANLPQSSLPTPRMVGTSMAGSSSKLPPPSPSPVKKRLLACVEIPSKGPSCSPLKAARPPSSSDRKGKGKASSVFRSPEKSDDDVDWEMQDGEDVPHTGPASGSGQISVGGSRTGSRDTRSGYQRLTSLFDDIFEAEDELPYPLDGTSLTASRHFGRISRDGSNACLSIAAMRKLDTTINKIQQRHGRRRKTAVGATFALASGGGGTAMLGPIQWDTQALSRILKIIERSVDAAQELILFPSDSPDDEERGRPKAKGKKTKRAVPKAHVASSSNAEPTRRSSRSATRSTSRSRTTPLEDTPVLMPSPEQSKASKLAEFDFDDVLGRLVEGASAASSLLALLSCDDIPKQIFSENVITGCINLVKHICETVLLPYISAVRDSKAATSSHLLTIVKADVSSGKKTAYESPLFHVCEAATLALRHLASLINVPDLALSDSLVIQAVYTSIGPIFGGDPHDTGKRVQKAVAVAAASGLPSFKALKLESLGLLRSLFAKNKPQRHWILEEVMSSLTKLPPKAHEGFWLRDGRSIHSISALMLLLIQTCCDGVDKQAISISQARNDVPSEESDRQTLVAELDAKESNLYTSALDSAADSAQSMASFLINKSSGSKGAKDADGEYRALLETVIKDTVSVLHWPEWPAAVVLTHTFARHLINALDEAKAGSEHLAAKSLALDHLGTIAAGLRTSSMRNCSLPILRSVATVPDESALRASQTAYRQVTHYLSNHAGDDQSFSTARDYMLCELGQGLVSAMKTAHVQAHPALIKELEQCMAALWSDSDDNVFKSSNEDEAAEARNAALGIGCTQHGPDLFEPTLRALLVAMDGVVVAARTKALRGLMSIVTVDPDLLALNNVQSAVKNRLLDSSPAVREAAIELLGKYVIQHPKLVDDYYAPIGFRIADTGLGVRKRVVKLLKAIYQMREEMHMHVDISIKLVSLMGDEDETVKELACRSIGELWFAPTELATPDKSNEMTACIVLAVSAHYGDKNSYLHEVFAQMTSGSDSDFVHAKIKAMSDFAIDRLMDSDDDMENRVINCIKTVHILASASPAVIGIGEAGQLLSFLRNPVNAEDQAAGDLLLGIFSLCIPYLPKTASTFARDLTARLLPMIGKPSGGQSLLKDAVGCLCKVVVYLSKDYPRLVTMLKSCDVKLQNALQSFAKFGSVSEEASRPVITLMYIAALLAESCDFDKVRVEQEGLRKSIDNISLDSITDYLFDTFLDYTNLDLGTAAQIKIMSCLGCLFRAHATLMTTMPATEWMDATFASGPPEFKTQLLRMIQDVLVSEAAKRPAADPNIKMTRDKTAYPVPTPAYDINDLVGSATDLQESGVSTAIVQRYLTVILDMAVSSFMPVQRTAVEVLSFTVTQGLAHPLQCLPVIIALETSNMPYFSDRALSLHATLHAKHPDLISTRFVEFARSAFAYQTSRHPLSSVSGVRHIDERPIALLHGWYCLVREKRGWRQDMLKALGKLFQVDPFKATTTPQEVVFVRFVAENLSAFDYKTHEEVLTVIHFLTAALAACVVPLVEIFEDGQLQEGGEELAERVFVGDTGVTATALHLANASVVIGIALLLKDHLKRLHGLSEDKCSKFVIGKKSPAGDKAAVKRNEGAIRWDRLPASAQGIETVTAFEQQRETMTALIAADGTLDEWLNQD